MKRTFIIVAQGVRPPLGQVEHEFAGNALYNFVAARTAEPPDPKEISIHCRHPERRNYSVWKAFVPHWIVDKNGRRFPDLWIYEQTSFENLKGTF